MYLLLFFSLALMNCVQDLVGKLKDAAKSVEKASQMWCRCPVSSHFSAPQSAELLQNPALILISSDLLLYSTLVCHVCIWLIIPDCVLIKKENKPLFVPWVKPDIYLLGEFFSFIVLLCEVWVRISKPCVFSNSLWWIFAIVAWEWSI